jgi:hypothetical protein
MKKSFLSFLMAAALIAPAMVMTSCNNNDDPKPGPTVDNQLAGTISSDSTLDATIEYLLTGQLLVADGATLTIPAGTVIKAKKGFGSYILVEQGGKINVNGTAAAPVTMTSNEASPSSGDWGGLIINGRAPLTAADEVGKTEIANAYAYGGTKADDNSGTITYLVIEYAGAKSSANVEHNGLTLNGVGNKTTIENIYVYKSADDGIEFFGGSVNVTNLLVISPDDDMFDFTQGYTGTLKNCYGIWEKGFSSSEADPRGVEADGNLDGLFAANPNQSTFTIENMTIDVRLDPVTATTDDATAAKITMQDALKVRRGATATVINALVLGSGTVTNIVDLTDGAGVGFASAEGIKVVNSLKETPATPINGDATNVTVTDKATPAATDGCATSVFGWTGYQF